MKFFEKHFKHYFILLVVLISGLLLFLLFGQDDIVQQLIIVALGALYVAWGAWHHSIHKDLHLSVLIEYIIIATLGVFSVLSLLYWS